MEYGRLSIWRESAGLDAATARKHAARLELRARTEDEIAVRHRGDAYRTVYAVQLDDDVWVLHAFQKKSKTGIKTPKHEVDLIRERIKRVMEQLR